jgi:hypothetical protein
VSEPLPTGPLILWVDGGCEGWKPHDCSWLDVMRTIGEWSATRWVVTRGPVTIPGDSVDSRPDAL